MRHVIWDWNGTLFADQPIVLAAVNDALRGVGLLPISLAEYRRVPKRPVRPFYELIARRALTDDEWEAIDSSYHDAYLRRLDQVSLHPQTVPVLEACAAGAVSQSLLSMWPHAELLPLVRQYGLAAYFGRIDGYQGECGGEKVEHLTEHLMAIGAGFGVAAHETAVVGDSVDDAVAANHCGARAILLASDTYDRDLLLRQPAAVVDDLRACLPLLLNSDAGERSGAVV